MRNEMDFRFDDLSLPDGSLVDGTANICFDAEGEFYVDEIWLQSTVYDATGVAIRKFCELSRSDDPRHYDQVCTALEKQLGDVIADRVSNELEYAL